MRTWPTSRSELPRGTRWPAQTSRRGCVALGQATGSSTCASRAWPGATPDTTAARELPERAVEDAEGYLHQTVSARETLGDMAVERGDRATAEEPYRRILALSNQSGSTGSVEISLADLLLDTGRPADREEASALLDAWMNRPEMKFDQVLFR